MGSGAHTTVIRRVLERRAQKIPHVDDGSTTATVAVMVRVLPPPKALLVFTDPVMRKVMDQRISGDVLDCQALDDEHKALALFKQQYYPVVVTDSQMMVRMLRAHTEGRPPFVLFVADLDEATEREGGLAAGADDCVGKRVSDAELTARIQHARRIAELEAVLRITLQENRKLSATDDLTRLASRRFFGKQFPREVDRAARYRKPLALLLCDIDHFKHINDTCGHAGGDQILRQFGPRLKQVLRRHVDWVARIGGEEFAIVMPETPFERACEAARRLRRNIEQTPFTVDKGPLRVTASFGLCSMEATQSARRGARLAERLLRIADAALYRSKREGRNRVTATTLEAEETRESQKT
jgi:two-component system, cell cycle response regulator